MVGSIFCEDRDSFEDCLCENDAISTKEERARIRKQLADTTHAKLMLKTDQPPVYKSYNIIYHLFINCLIFVYLINTILLTVIVG